jgi:membrane associated rhomboid family serine protease
LITCQKCRALLEPGTKECPYCQTDQRHHAAPTEAQDAERTTRFGLWILGFIIAVFLVMVILDPARGDPGAGRFRPSPTARLMFGGADPFLVGGCGQYWRLLASLFLHGDLLHLAFNAIALLVLIPIAAGAFGVHRTVCIYFAAGLCGGLLSHGAGSGGVGASGALCGLIGACLAWGKRRGGAVGDAIAQRMIGWAIFIAVLGVGWNRVASRTFIDNAAHLGGFLGGMGLGWLAAGIRARGGAADRAWTLAARLTVVGAVVVAAVFWAPYAYRIFERRDVELYQSAAVRTVAAIDAALREGRPEDLPEEFRDGPGGTEEVRDAVREALDLARRRDPRAEDSLDRAREALDLWSSTLFCDYLVTR